MISYFSLNPLDLKLETFVPDSNSILW